MLWRTFGGRSEPWKGRMKDSRIPSTWLGSAGSREPKVLLPFLWLSGMSECKDCSKGFDSPVDMRHELHQRNTKKTTPCLCHSYAWWKHLSKKILFSPCFLLKSRVCMHEINSRQRLYLRKIEFGVIDFFLMLGFNLLCEQYSKHVKCCTSMPRGKKIKK